MLNSVILMGRICSDIELRTTTTGKSVANFRMAVDRSYTKPGEQRQTDFITIIAWGSTADFVSRYFSKGSMIAVQGSIQTRNYEDKNGNKRTAFEVVAREVSFCGGKNEGNNSGNPNSSPAIPEYSSTIPEADFEEVGADDDLPF